MDKKSYLKAWNVEIDQMEQDFKKLIAVMIQITAINLMIYILSIVSMIAVGEDVPWKELNLLHLGYFILQIELAGICFGISALA